MATTTSTDSLANRFRENARHLLGERGLSHAALAERLGCSPNHVTQTLNSEGSGLRLATVERWAVALEIDDPLDLLKNPAA